MSLFSIYSEFCLLTLQYRPILFSFYLIIAKCNNNTTEGCHLAQQEELLKPRQAEFHVAPEATSSCVLLKPRQILFGEIKLSLTMPVKASTILHVEQHGNHHLYYNYSLGYIMELKPKFKQFYYIVNTLLTSRLYLRTFCNFSLDSEPAEGTE